MFVNQEQFHNAFLVVFIVGELLKAPDFALRVIFPQKACTQGDTCLQSDTSKGLHAECKRLARRVTPACVRHSQVGSL